ncbi:hypothetical protein [Echinicola strongylocentroti]|uniref:hypothetical protein n=1 Tax=Echinicola strongylocentroti TaxID=1795355 RepID=UPI0013A6F5DC|nr:hypothetical protein [Echinicola strongylocentroti]
MPVFQPMVEAVKKGSWLASWNSETHSFSGRSSFLKLNWGPNRTRWKTYLFQFKELTTGLGFWLFSSMKMRSIHEDLLKAIYT